MFFMFNIFYKNEEFKKKTTVKFEEIIFLKIGL